jgi:hypothetical protein
VPEGYPISQGHGSGFRDASIREELVDVIVIKLKRGFIVWVVGRILVCNRCDIILVVRVIGVGIRIDIWGVWKDLAIWKTDDLVQYTIQGWVCARNYLRWCMGAGHYVMQRWRGVGWDRWREESGRRGRISWVCAWCAHTGTMRREKGCAERIKHARAILLLVKMCGSNIWEFIVGECDVEGGYEKVECLARRLLVHRAKRGELRLAVKPWRKWRWMGELVVVGMFKGFEEFLVAFDVLAAICFNTSVHRAFWALVSERLREAW